MRVALVAIVKEEKHLEEWCRYHAFLGFNHIYLYCNDWLPTPVKLPGMPISLLPITGQAKQLECYQAWPHKYGMMYDFVMYLDADEYLYLVKWNSVQEMIKQLGDTRSIAINWVFFGNPDSEASGVVTQYVYRDEKPDQHVKILMRLHQGNEMKDPHNGKHPAMSPEHKLIEGPFNKHGSMENAFIAHYYYQDVEHWMRKVARGRADSKVFNRRSEPWMPGGAYSVRDERLRNYYNGVLKLQLC